MQDYVNFLYIIDLKENSSRGVLEKNKQELMFASLVMTDKFFYIIYLRG